MGNLCRLVWGSLALPNMRGWEQNLSSALRKSPGRKGFQRLVVISAIGTRQYYQKLDFYNGDLYQIKDL